MRVLPHRRRQERRGLDAVLPHIGRGPSRWQRLMQSARREYASIITLKRRKHMSHRTLVPVIASAFVVLTVSAVAIFAQSPADQGVLTRSRYLPEYTAADELKLPENSMWRDWVFVGAPLTPNALNGGQANFPEYHYVYIEPGSYEIYRKTGAFPDGTIFFKELQLTKGPSENPDGSRTEPSGRGFFPGEFNGADATVKDSKRFADTGGWGYFNFNHHEPKAPTAKVKDKSECAFCHIGAAKRDEVWTQFYPILDEVPLPQGGRG